MDEQRDANKRVRFFDGQILKADDFTQEQFYHRSRRQLHTQLLHAPGVVTGLGVTGTANANSVTVKAGTAINARGEEIIVSTDTPFALSSLADTANAEIYVTPRPEQTDAGTLGQATRVAEKAMIVGRKPSATEPDGGVLLASVSVSKDGTLVPQQAGAQPNPNNTVRVWAGVRLDDTMALRRSATGRVDLSGSLRVNGDILATGSITASDKLLVSGNVGVGEAMPSSRLHVVGNPDQQGTARFAPHPTKGPNHSHVHWDATGDWYIRSAAPAGKVVIQDTGGGVGIGTSSPVSKLQVKALTAVDEGPTVAGAWSNFGSNAYFDGAWKRIDTTKAGVSLHVNADGAGQEFRFYRVEADGSKQRNLAVIGSALSFINEGNVGIGTPAPPQKLTISGAEAAPHGFGAAIGLSNTAAGGANWYLRAGATGTSTPPGGFSIADDAAYRLVVDRVGNVGVGTVQPADRVDIAGTLRILTGANPIRFTAGWSGFPDPATNQAEISNDTGTYKTLMIVGNKSAGMGRRVSVWDRLEVNGTLQVNGPGLEVNGTLQVTPRLEVNGTLRVNGPLVVTGPKSGYVVDQFVNRLGEVLEEGDVMVIGEHQTPLYHGASDNIPILETDLAQQAYDSRVCGVVAEVFAELMTSEAPREARASSSRGNGKTTAKGRTASSRALPETTQVREFAAEELSQRDRSKVAPGQVGFMVTMGAYAHCKVDADIAPVRIGDLLTTSPTKGHAQKVLDPSKAVGTILGKALGTLKKGKGKIPVLVMLE